MSEPSTSIVQLHVNCVCVCVCMEGGGGGGGWPPWHYHAIIHVRPYNELDSNVL